MLAELGLPSLEAAVGRTDLLQQVRYDGNLDLGPMLANVGEGPLHWEGARNNRPEERPPVDDSWMNPALSAVAAGKPFECSVTVKNEDRSLGARLAGELALRKTAQPNLHYDVHLRMRGAAGQSFGAFATKGMRLELVGQANDFVGKGLSGGEIVIRSQGKLINSESPEVILGNVALYGATAGSLFAEGKAGERFAIRNSGATAVIEGVGDHGCEYMTGGVVLVLGPTGINFGAGMTGGVAYVWDPNGTYTEDQKYHADFVGLELLDDCGYEERAVVRSLLEQHIVKTASKLARRLHQAWPVTLKQMLRVAPKKMSLM
jgi:glutamate synthase (NADPH/NADH) large chain